MHKTLQLCRRQRQEYRERSHSPGEGAVALRSSRPSETHPSNLRVNMGKKRLADGCTHHAALASCISHGKKPPCPPRAGNHPRGPAGKARGLCLENALSPCLPWHSWFLALKSRWAPTPRGFSFPATGECIRPVLLSPACSVPGPSSTGSGTSAIFLAVFHAPA